jgi:hypothetical protein
MTLGAEINGKLIPQKPTASNQSIRSEDADALLHVRA